MGVVEPRVVVLALSQPEDRARIGGRGGAHVEATQGMLCRRHAARSRSLVAQMIAENLSQLMCRTAPAVTPRVNSGSAGPAGPRPRGLG